MEQYIMALDQGTTSSRCIIYDKKGNAVSISKQEFTQYFPDDGWVEHDAMEIWETQLEVAREAMEKAEITCENIAAIGITNQRETTVVWDKNTGKPVYNAIVWQCRRTAEFCDLLKEHGFYEMIRKKTGLIIDSYFSATKLKWILDCVEGAYDRAVSGEILFGTIETWLIWNLTGGKIHVTDYSNAARTMMFDINKLQWDDDILEMLDIPKSVLPEVKPSSCIYGKTDPSIFGGSIPIAGAAGDQQAALFGQTCFCKGQGKITYGTGGFMLINTGNELVHSGNGLLATIAWGINGKVSYAIEGSVFIAGAAIQWLRDEIRVIDDASDSQKICDELADTSGIYVVPAFTGLGAPYWEPNARGAVFGITRDTSREHLIRATVESIAYQTRDLVNAVEEDVKEKIKSLRVDGGACRNDFLMQFQSDIADKEVIRPKNVETTSLGAAYLAGLEVGYWQNKDDIIANWQEDRTFTPEMTDEKRASLCGGWHCAVKAVLNWAGRHE